MEIISKFLIWCSGADAELLETLKVEKQRFLILGFSIFTTSLLAFVAGYYAFSVISESASSFSSILFGFVWSSLIFSIDRIIFQGFDSIGSNKTFSYKVIRSLPLIILSLLIAFLLSYPLNLEIFKGPIEIEKKIIKNEKAITLYNEKNRPFEKNLVELKIKILNKEAENKNLEKQLLTEMEGKTKGFGPSFIFLKQNILANEKVIDSLKLNYNILNDNFQRQKQRNVEEAKETVDFEMSGFIGKLNAFYSLTSKNNSFYFISILVFLIFFSIRSLPIFSRFFISTGIYEKRLEEQNTIQYKKTLKSKPNNAKSNLTELDSYYFGFEDFYSQVIRNVNKSQIDSSKKANNLLVSGIIIIIVGLMLYILWVFNWINVFKSSSFKSYQIYSLVAGSLFFLFVEGLGGWFLKQYKYTLEKSHFSLKLKTILERQLLAYLFVKETDKKSSKIDDFRERIVEMLKSDIHFPEINDNVNNSFIKESLETLTNLSDTVKKVAASK